ncbi:hypothetical protein AB8O53_00385 [Streptomyces pilosus]
MERGWKRRLWPGAALVAAATGALIYALIRAGDHGWLNTVSLVLCAAAVAAYAAFVAWQRRTSAPLMDLRLLGRQPVVAGLFVITVATALMVGAFFLGSFYLQNSPRSQDSGSGGRGTGAPAGAPERPGTAEQSAGPPGRCPVAWG